MYLILFRYEGDRGERYHSCGSDWTQRTNLRQAAAIRGKALAMLGNKPGEVYKIPYYTQEMCEMSPAEFTRYVTQVGKRVV